ncbi:MAG: DNA processing protein DprA [Gammaproteobacteria bacterium 39-13]|nr:DNA-protecting protein DprA [Gammaproteobacteria bacterium]OJV94076.1 MAG: DNA processing protein DprA [Gammaproteobacteria bacterium 39-13]
MQSAFTNLVQELSPISKYREAVAYEALWDKKDTTFKRIAELFGSHPESLPSQLISTNEIKSYEQEFDNIIKKYNVPTFGIILHNVDEFPQKLRDAKYPVELFYFRGYWDLVESKCISVVGTRHPTPEGIKRAKKLVKHLVEDGFTIVSGLATGIDTVAHETAIELGGKTIAVIGTPLSHNYPKENVKLQDEIAENHLLISQVPFCKYEHQPININRLFFPERNITMSALSLGSIIVEAGETSGTLIQARAALSQNRKLFILENNFLNEKLTWPQKYLKKGAIRVKDYEEIKASLNGNTERS